MYEELEAKKLLIAHEKLVNQKLEERIQAMESKLLCGGKNIVDHTNEQQRALEQRNQEIAERKVSLTLSLMFVHSESVTVFS
jgi:kinesin family protein 3/17